MLILWSVFVVVYFYLVRLFSEKKSKSVPQLFHRGCCRILGVRTHLTGDITETSPALFVANHISYLDIFVLGAYLPGAFISKSEVASWPLLGQLARLQDTLFIERKGSHSRGQITQIQGRLEQRQNLILFPEGTSSAGMEVIPFKSTLFQAAEISLPVMIQPVCIHYSNSTMDQRHELWRDDFAWYADMPFLSHFIRMAGLSGLNVEINVLPAVRLTEFGDRKDCAAYCYQQVSENLSARFPAS